MKIILFSFSIFLGISCTTRCVKKNVDSPPSMVGILDTLPDPYLKFIPDSLKEWIPLFDSIFRNDQKYRTTEKKFNDNLSNQKALDSINLKIVSSFLGKYGYPSIKQVGLKGFWGIKAVLQHAPLTVQEKYYPLLTEAYRKEYIKGEALAIFEDRINMRRHRKQFYGTQTIRYKKQYTLYPVVDIDSLDTYRKRMNFIWNISTYLKMLKIDWNPANYRNELPDIMVQNKVSDTPGIHFIK